MKVYHYYGEKNSKASFKKHKIGLYDPEWEHDSCGIGFVAHIQNQKSRDIIDKGLQIICNLEHRGAIGADPQTGDGAGIMMQMPHEFLCRIAAENKFKLPEPGQYGVGVHFFPQEKKLRKSIENIVEKITLDEELEFLGWRDVPVNSKVIGRGAREMMPFIKQSFIKANAEIKNKNEFERKLFMVRRMIDHRIRQELDISRSLYYVPSFSCKTLVYKGMITGRDQFVAFYPDLLAQDMKSSLALIHTRFSTNTFPSWDLAHPFRLIAHNGEINTLRGNINWMAAREKVMHSPYFGKELKRMLPILMEGQSDSAAFDSVFELLVMSGRSLPHAIMMMIPEAWSKNDLMDPELRGFYEYHAALMEPWDGPAGVIFSDGDVIGGTLDRNGLRPARYVITKNDLVILSSEVGVLGLSPESVKCYGRLQPGRMFLVDLIQKRIIPDEEVKKEISRQKPYKNWVENNIIRSEERLKTDLMHRHKIDRKTLLEQQRVFLYTKEDLNIVITPMLISGKEAVGSMGSDVSLAVLSEKPQLLFRYFKQLFAQVTNPPVDAIREELVFELTTYMGPEKNLLEETSEHANRIELSHPVISNAHLKRIKNISQGKFRSSVLKILFDIRDRHGMREKMEQLCKEAEELARGGINLLILSDRGVGKNIAPIPSLLAVAGIHHHLIRNGLRTEVSIIVESGEPREVSHFGMLCGYGANAINPYLAFDSIDHLYDGGFLTEIDSKENAYKNYYNAIKLGLYKIFSKMGISTLQSYCGAQIFEAVGLDSEIIENYFTGTSSNIEGLSLEMLEAETIKKHQMAYDPLHNPDAISSGGIYQYRYDGENHLWNPISIAKLQVSVRNTDYDTYKEYAALINHQERKRVTLRSLLDFDYFKKPLDRKEVEPSSEILKRFSTGAMSFGSISWEAHTSLAIAMNHIGGKSNTGEGGEDPIRYKLIEGKNMRSAIKQVASGRFGVTAEYLVNADELQIKMAQGAKPGEGGQLPGFKVDEVIARIRHSTPGVMLISPPPHHDIYSIEDLKQLIFDLKNINPKARISVKLVSEVGVGTVAAGVAKAHADHILISGHDGGTGASPISSIQYAGTPWEIGLSQTHQTLVLNGLRDRVWLQVDGQIKTGRDVVIGALMGADEFGFSTAPLVTQGCIMMRKCHLNTCPVGVATQDIELRKKFAGSPEYLISYMHFVAEEIREYMAKLGFRTFNEMIGQIDRLVHSRPSEMSDEKKIRSWKIRGINLNDLLTKPKPKFGSDIYRTKNQDHGLLKQIDHQLIHKAKMAIEKKKKIQIKMPVKNINRSVGTMLSHEIAIRYGHKGLPDNTIQITMNGAAGQSFGAFLVRGIELKLLGVANDYTGKGISGGRLIIKIPDDVSFDPAHNMIIGNTTFYGAVEGEAYINGMAGERFCVRNSGVHAVVEGVGDHGCEYMTGGRVVILGSVGRNFAAGMSGGIAYVWDPERTFYKYVNQEMVEIEVLESPGSVEETLKMITSHHEHTRSHRSQYILANWSIERKNFYKITPVEYKMALMKMEKEKAKEIKSSKMIASEKV